jgi:hypothetical protein
MTGHLLARQGSTRHGNARQESADFGKPESAGSWLGGTSQDRANPSVPRQGAARQDKECASLRIPIIGGPISGGRERERSDKERKPPFAN